MAPEPHARRVPSRSTPETFVLAALLARHTGAPCKGTRSGSAPETFILSTFLACGAGAPCKESALAKLSRNICSSDPPCTAHRLKGPRTKLPRAAFTAGLAVLTSRPQRMMSGSLLFTKAEFEQQYGGVTEWERAAPRAASSARGRGGSVADLSSILRQHAAAGVVCLGAGIRGARYTTPAFPVPAARGNPEMHEFPIHLKDYSRFPLIPSTKRMNFLCFWNPAG